MVDTTIVQEWIAKADEDYLFACKHLLDEDSFFSPLCFHGQQTAEKFLKAYIVRNELPLRKIHDLLELLSICESHDTSFSELRDDLTLLQRYYVDTRYPAVWPIGTTKRDAEEALDAAGRIREFVLEKLDIKK